MMPIDQTLLYAAQDALRPPFADPVKVLGVPMSRETARCIERNLLQVKAGHGKVTA